MRLKQYAETNTALGSDVTLTVVSRASESKVAKLLGRLWHDIYVFERQFSRFLPMSELSVFNRSAGLEMPISPEFKTLLQAAKALGEQTNGLYNPFILPALQRAGYTKSHVAQYANDTQDDHSAKQVVAVNALKINQNTASIPYGTALDLGGCGKGYLGQQLSDSMPDWVQGYWLSLGGDVAAAGQDASGKLWQVSVQRADNPSKSSDFVISGASKQFAVATSGTIIHKGIHNGKPWHHIIDPRSLQPAATDVLLATVYAKSSLQADVLASCAILLGSKKALPYLKKHGAKAVLLQCSDGKEGFVRHFGRAIQIAEANMDKAGIYA